MSAKFTHRKTGSIVSIGRHTRKRAVRMGRFTPADVQPVIDLLAREMIVEFPR